MDKMLVSILNSLNNGIIILDDNLKILYWNDYMVSFTGCSREKSMGQVIYEVLPKLDQSFFKQSILKVLENGTKLFFSAAIHKDLINATHKINLKVTKIAGDDGAFILMECIDVTQQFLRISQLEETVNKLYLLNEELKQKEKTINSLAYYDSLTGIANRTLFYEMAEKFCAALKRDPRLGCILFIDLDNFKIVNDTYGHRMGDQVLVKVSQALVNATRSGDLVARFGGDEFVMFLSVNYLEDIIQVARRIIEQPIRVSIQGDEITISVSLGISVWQKDEETLDELISNADRAMYVAKRSGGNNWHMWDPEKDA